MAKLTEREHAETAAAYKAEKDDLIRIRAEKRAEALRKIAKIKADAEKEQRQLRRSIKHLESLIYYHRKAWRVKQDDRANPGPERRRAVRIGRRIKLCRLLHGWKPKDAAMLLGINVETYRAWERGENKANLRRLQKIMPEIMLEDIDE